MRKKVYIDGQEGTTGLKIIERFKNRDDIELLKIDEDKRKDLKQRSKLINSSDYTFLCLPDVASIEAVSLVENENVKIIDASTAHRTNPEWAYGFPELSKQHREKIANSKRVAVPGCYASGFISLAYPLVQAGIIKKDAAIISHAISGYSGGGKKMIAQYESKDDFKEEYLSPRQYALSQQHKHQKEMQIISGFDFKPMFNPIVANYFSGMVVSIPLITRTLAKKVSPQEICSILKQNYAGEKFVKVMDFMGEGVLQDGFIAANTLANKNDMQLFVFGNEDQILLCSRLDNLSKGASGAAVQCMNIMMGIDETTGLI